MIKKLTFAILSAAMILTSCSGDKSNETASQETAKPVATGDSFEPTTNIRYYNLDSIMTQYSLCKDLNDVMAAKQSNIESEQRAKTAELQRMQQQIESKAQ